MSIKVVEWISIEDSIRRGLKESIGGLGGWFNLGKGGQRWADYISSLPPDNASDPYAEAIREEVLANNYRFGGDTHQESRIPVFNDQTIGHFSFRAWGDIMAAIWSEEEDKDYSYLDFYMTDWG